MDVRQRRSDTLDEDLLPPTLAWCEGFFGELNRLVTLLVVHEKIETER